MRLLFPALAFAIGLVAPPAANAFSVFMQSRGPTQGLQASDTVAIDVFIESDVNLPVADLSVAVLFDPHLVYDPVASAALPIIHPAPSVAYNTTGAQAGYLFYVPHAGILYPGAAPAFAEWPTPPPGVGQVNVSYDYEPHGINSSYTYMATGITWIASLVFHVSDAQAGSIELSLTAGGAGIEEAVGNFIDPATITLGAPIVVPEPESLLLIAVGIAAALAISSGSTHARSKR